MSRLARDGTAKPVSRDQILGTHGDRGIFIFPVQLTTCRIGNLTRLIHTLLYVMTIHTYLNPPDGEGEGAGAGVAPKENPPGRGAGAEPRKLIRKKGGVPSG